MKEHLAFLDGKLASLIEKHNLNTSFIITGDHGCRSISRYVVEVENDKMTMAVYRAIKDKLEFIERYVVESKEDIHKIEYDGGNLKIWFKNKGGKLTKNDLSFVQKYGEIQPINDENKKRYYHKSNHPNQGDVTIIAHKDVMFCKKDWIRKEGVIEEISLYQDLEKNDLPRGEHGTYHDEDRIVVFMSNYDFDIKEIPNIMVPVLICDLMGGNVPDIMSP